MKAKKEHVDKELMIIKLFAFNYARDLIYTVFFENGDLNRRCQEKYMLIQPLKRKKMILKKGRPNICV